MNFPHQQEFWLDAFDKGRENGVQLEVQEIGHKAYFINHHIWYIFIWNIYNIFVLLHKDKPSVMTWYTPPQHSDPHRALMLTTI